MYNIWIDYVFLPPFIASIHHWSSVNDSAKVRNNEQRIGTLTFNFNSIWSELLEILLPPSFNCLFSNYGYRKQFSNFELNFRIQKNY